MRVFLAKLFIRFFSLLPLGIAHFLGGTLGRIALLFPNQLKLPMRKNIELCFPEMSAQEKNKLYKKSFIELYRSLAEIGALWLWSKEKILAHVFKISGEEHLEKAIAKGKGTILAFPHLGAWEILNLYCADKYTTTTLYKPVKKMSGLNPLIKESRERSGATLVPTDRQGVRMLYEALGRNELVGILPDQDPGKEGGVFAPFCGIPASTMTLLPRLANKTRATVIFGYAERLPGGKGFHLHFLPAPVDTFDSDLTSAATQLNIGIETCIRQLPQQYQWGYKRFKTRPEGKNRFY